MKTIICIFLTSLLSLQAFANDKDAIDPLMSSTVTRQLIATGLEGLIATHVGLSAYGDLTKTPEYAAYATKKSEVIALERQRRSAYSQARQIRGFSGSDGEPLDYYLLEFNGTKRAYDSKMFEVGRMDSQIRSLKLELQKCRAALLFKANSLVGKSLFGLKLIGSTLLIADASARIYQIAVEHVDPKLRPIDHPNSSTLVKEVK